MPDFGSFRGFGEKLVQGQTPTQLGTIGSINTDPLMLDTYPNAASAYSLRKLRTLYTGSAIRVRRSSDNAEQDIGFTAQNILDTSTLTSFCGANNGFITTWYDQSGNGRNATQTTAANQPILVLTGSVINENGKPTLQFDGSNDGFTINNRPLINASNFSIFSVCNFKTANQYEMLFVQSDGTANSNRLEIRRDISQDRLQYIGNDTASSSTSGTIAINNKQILLSYIGQLNIITAHINNALDATSTNQNILIGDYAAQIGQRSGFYYAGVMQELVIYASNLTTNRTAISNNLNSHYAIY